MRAVVVLALLLLYSLLGDGAAFAQSRVALVIGNDAYTAVPALANAVRDANAMSTAFKNLNFDKVTYATDLSYNGLSDALKKFSADADKADWAVIYYSGHGIEIGGKNYLIPVDAILKKDRDVDQEAIDLDRVLSTISGAKQLRLVILDACRNNPFANKMTRTIGSRSIGRGLGQIEPEAGTLVVYAAKHGETASDGIEGQNGPLVTSMLQRMRDPELEIRRLFDFVRDDVMAATRNEQQPFTYGSLSARDNYYFTPQKPVEQNKIQTTMQPSLSAAAEAWMAIQSSTSIAVWEEFIRQYGATPYGAFAKARLAELKNQQPSNMKDAKHTPAPPPITNITPAKSSPTEPTAPNADKPVQNIPSVPRSALIIEAPDEPTKVKTYIGTVIWSTSTKTTTNGTFTIMHGDVVIGDADLKFEFNLQKNDDPNFPADILMDLRFNGGPQSQIKAIKDMSMPEMRQEETARGEPLKGGIVAITPTDYMEGLSRVDREKTRNNDLLTQRGWFDLPMSLPDGRAAKLTIEKGQSGENALSEALK